MGNRFVASYIAEPLPFHRILIGGTVANRRGGTISRTMDRTDDTTPDPTDAQAEALRVDPLKMARDRRLVLERFGQKLRDNLARLPFVEDAAAAFHAAMDPRTPFRAKAVLLGALAYFIVPADAVPDFMLMLGYTDDAAVLALALKTVRDNLRPEHYERARAWLRAHRAGTATPEEVKAGPIIDHDPIRNRPPT